jgi:hypothetical protein
MNPKRQGNPVRPAPRNRSYRTYQQPETAPESPEERAARVDKVYNMMRGRADRARRCGRPVAEEGPQPLSPPPELLRIKY